MEMDPSTAVEAERRKVTVLFTDTVGFTAFSEAASEEAAFPLMQDVAMLTGKVVREHGGAVQNFTGDDVSLLFYLLRVSKGTKRR